MVLQKREDYSKYISLFTDMMEIHLSIKAVLKGTIGGKLWVDHPQSPSVGLIETPEGLYLAGISDDQEVFQSLKEIIPTDQYLICDPEQWGGKLGDIWWNALARLHDRHNLKLKEFLFTNWRDSIPKGFQCLSVDRALIEKKDLVNHEEVMDWVESWPSIEDFLKRGFGHCIIHGDRIVSWSLADCVVDQSCEMGIKTDPEYRKQGLASIAVAANLEHCQKRGLTDVGWHCLSNNQGSIALAEKMGFVLSKEYSAYSGGIPAENPEDLTSQEYRDWAEHYEKFLDVTSWASFFAAQARTMAGDMEMALALLERMAGEEWEGDPQWLRENWRFASLQGLPAFEELLRDRF